MFFKPATLTLVFFMLSISMISKSQVLTFTSVEQYAGRNAGSENGSRLNARFNEPIDMVFDSNGNLYIAEEGGSVIRIMDTNGNVSSFVGSSGNTGLVDGTGANARFNQIRGIKIDNDGNIIVADKDNHAIRKVTPAGVVTTIAGGVEGFLDGDVSVARFNKPTQVLIHSSGDIYVTDAENNRIRKIDTDGNVTTVIGQSTAGYTDGDINSATLTGPNSLAFDSSGDLIITNLQAVRKYSFDTEELSTIVGGASATPYRDGDKNTAGFNALNGLFIDDNDVIYVVDRHGIRHVEADGTVTTLAGSGTQGTDNGAPLDSRFFFPRGIIQNADGDFLIADKASHKIRRIFTESPIPQLRSSIPADNGQEFSGSEISLVFDRNVFIGRGAISIFDGEDDRLVRRFGVRKPNVSINGNTVTVNINRPLPRNKNYYIQIAPTAFKDAAGNFFPGITDETTLNFGSATDLLLVSTSPENGATEFEGTQITLTFNKNVIAGRGRISIRDFEDDSEITGAGARSSRVTILDNVVTLDLIKPLPVNKEVYMRIPGSAFTDDNGIRASAEIDKSLRFQTKTVVPLTLEESSPADNDSDFSGSEISLVFNQDIVKGRGRIKILNAADDEVVFSAGVNSSKVIANGTSLLIQVPGGLPPGTDLYLNVPGAAIKNEDDLQFPGISDKTTLNFTTSQGTASSRSEFDLTDQTETTDPPINQGNSELRAYPNPASTEISFDLSQMKGPLNLQILSTSSEVKLLRTDITQRSATIDVSSYSNGIYLARITQQDGYVVTKKFVVLR